jgi:kinesin family protein 2/24
MLGDSSGERPVAGVFTLAIEDLFQLLQEYKEEERPAVGVSFYEIYCGKLYDLLNNRKHLHARENARGNVVIQGVKEIDASSAGLLMDQVQVGLSSRTTGVTGANVDSSRSHAIISISLKVPGPKGRLVSKSGRLSFIDLAGSERGADTVDQDKQTRIDGAEINKSLLALKECIRALDQQLEHTPFRGSKLTQVLKDSFVGQNCMTLMIANISPSSGSVEHTLNTLRYAYRVKELRGPAVRRQLQQAQPAADDANLSTSHSVASSSARSSMEPLSEGKPVVDLEVLAKDHDKLIGVILAEEEELIATHRKALDVFVQMLNEEAAQVNLIDQPGSDVDMYVAYMDENLRQKEEIVSTLRNRLEMFKTHLMEEERMSRLFDMHRLKAE